MKKLLLIVWFIICHLLAHAQIQTKKQTGKETSQDILDNTKKTTLQLTISQFRRGLADTSQAIYITDGGKAGNFRHDPQNQAADDSSMVLVYGNRRYVRDTDVLYPRFFGTKGDGKTDDTKALQRCLDYVKSNQTIDFQGYVYKFSKITLNTIDVILRGGGAKLIGTIIIGDDKPQTYNGKISGFYFASTEDAIQIRNVRKLEISGNTFSNNSKSIHVVEGPTGIHVNAMVEVNKNIFNDVDYCLFVARSPSASWMVSSDFTFEGNVANNALVTAVYANGIDGLKCINNVIFTPSDEAGRKSKRNHVRIERESDWVIIANNNFFESGEESLYLENCKAANINGNNFAWSGQKGIYDVIGINGGRKDLIINVTGNIFDCFSGNVISCSKGVAGSIGVVGNTMNFDNKMPRYYGKDSLNAINHYAISVGSAYMQIHENNSYSYGRATNFKVKSVAGNIANITKEGGYLQSTAAINVKVLPGTPVNLFKVSDEYLADNAYAGIINLTAKCAGNIANYQLMVTKPAKVLPGEAKLIMSAGLIEGKNNNHPSFNFTVVDGILRAVPIGKTAGEFTIDVKAEGALVISELSTL